MMDTSQQMTYLSRWSMQLTSLSPKLITLQLVSSCLIMRLATNVELLMLSLHATCPSFQTSTGLKQRGGAKMRNGWFNSEKTPQSFYFPEDHTTMPGWFKGMELIIKEQGLYPEGGLKSQCEGFKCVVGQKDCCCHHVLFNQPDFCAQKSHLEEYITSRGHICNFYPKYHCELNFIEQYWGAAKYIYRSSAKTVDLDAMEQNVILCLDDVPLLQIQR